MEEGIGDLNKAMALNPRNVFTYTNRSYGYLLMGKYDEALADANKAIEVGPTESYRVFLERQGPRRIE